MTWKAFHQCQMSKRHVLTQRLQRELVQLAWSTLISTLSFALRIRQRRSWHQFTPKRLSLQINSDLAMEQHCEIKVTFTLQTLQLWANLARIHREREGYRVRELLQVSFCGILQTHTVMCFFSLFFLSLVQEGILKAHALGAKVGINLGSSGIVRSQRLSSLRWSVSSFSGQFESESFRNNVRYVYFIDDKLIRCISCLVDIFLVKTCLVKSSNARGGSGNKMYMHV